MWYPFSRRKGKIVSAAGRFLWSSGLAAPTRSLI